MHSLVSKYLLFVACLSAFGLVYLIYIVRLVSTKNRVPILHNPFQYFLVAWCIKSVLYSKNDLALAG